MGYARPLLVLCLLSGLLVACAHPQNVSAWSSREVVVVQRGVDSTGPHRLHMGHPVPPRIVALLEDGVFYPLAELPRDAHFYDVTHSRGRRYAYVLYGTPRPDNEDAPHVHNGMMFDLSDRSLIAIGGFPLEGSLTWTAGDELWHEASRGTGVRQITRFDLQGETIESFMAGGVELSDDGRYQVVYPLHFMPRPVVITDMVLGDVVFEDFLLGDGDSPYRVDRVTWAHGRVTLRYVIENTKDADRFLRVIDLP